MGWSESYLVRDGGDYAALGLFAVAGEVEIAGLWRVVFCVWVWLVYEYQLDQTQT
jgi:hypothetical protein